VVGCFFNRINPTAGLVKRGNPVTVLSLQSLPCRPSARVSSEQGPDLLGNSSRHCSTSHIPVVGYWPQKPGHPRLFLTNSNQICLVAIVTIESSGHPCLFQDVGICRAPDTHLHSNAAHRAHPPNRINSTVNRAINQKKSGHPCPFALETDAKILDTHLYLVKSMPSISTKNVPSFRGNVLNDVVAGRQNKSGHPCLFPPCLFPINSMQSISTKTIPSFSGNVSNGKFLGTDAPPLSVAPTFRVHGLM